MSSDSLVVMSPVTGERVATVPNMDTAAIGDMARRARAAQPAWARLGFAGRARVLRPLARWLLDHSDDVFRVVCSETGKQYEDVLLELGGVVSALQFWSRHAKRYLAEQKYRSASPFVLGKKLRISYVPRGVAGVIAPWNFPLALGFGDSIPALMAGNSVILKPSEITPLSIEVIARGLIECGLPNNVFQIATGSAETGEALIDEADVIMFTGSTATGKKVLARAAETLTPVTTELGGKDAMIVLADADLERSANLAVYGSMLNGGQVCMSIERAYVHEDIYDEFVRCVVDKVDKLRVGPPAGFGRADIGAISSPAQMDVIERQVRNSEAMGAQILVGGQRKPGWGNYFEPTVLTEVNHDMECMRAETFGPILPIMKVASADEAVKLANDSYYGLSAVVCTRDTRAGGKIADRIEAGTVLVNDIFSHSFAFGLPMGGVKGSGTGARNGKAGIRKYCELRVTVTSRWHLKRDLHMFPYEGRRSAVLMRMIRLLYGRGQPLGHRRP